MMSFLSDVATSSSTRDVNISNSEIGGRAAAAAAAAAAVDDHDNITKIGQ